LDDLSAAFVGEAFLVCVRPQKAEIILAASKNDYSLTTTIQMIALTKHFLPKR